VRKHFVITTKLRHNSDDDAMQKYCV